MKTATITWLTYNNYGTILQAYALQKKIEQLGYENVILSDQEILKAYRASRHEIEKNKSMIQEKTESKSLFSRLVYLAIHPGKIYRALLARTDREKYERPYDDSQDKCIRFKQDELNILANVTIDKLLSLNEQFDVFIAGSDQIWSVFDDIFNPYYYLDFVKKKKIAYAPCLGTDKIPEKIAEKIKHLLLDYTAISVREKVSSEQLSELIGRKVEWVADPTLLHDKKFWSEFVTGVPVKKKKYLLCYFLENKKWYFDYARKLAGKLHLNIVLIPNKWDYMSSEHVTKDGVGPKEFVSLFQNAEYVLTDSYHGSIFSLMFEKNFQYLLRFANDNPNSQNIRVQSLFGFLELNNRIITEHSNKMPELEIDYRSVNKKIAEFRMQSIKYLEDSLRK